MAQPLERIGISLDHALLEQFDRLIAAQGYANRSEAVRDLIRDRLSREQLADPTAHAVAAVCLVYNHHRPQLTHKIMHLQHSRYFKTISTMHVHLNACDCLEVIVLRGEVAEITKLADALTSLKGVRLSRVSLLALQEQPDCRGHEHP